MKNQNPLLRYQYSWILVPLLTLLYILYSRIRIYLSFLMFNIGWVGIIIAWIIQLPLHLFILAVIGHLPVFIGLFYNEPFFEFNYTQVLFFIVGLFLIMKIPFWPYLVSRLTFLYVFIFVSCIYFLLTLIKFIDRDKLIKN